MRALRMHAAGEPTTLTYETAPDPSLGTGDVLVEVDAAGYTPGELEWPSTWVDRSGHDRTPIVPCYEVSGVVAKLGFGASGLKVGDAVYGLLDWYRDGGAGELVAVEARNLALRPRTVTPAAAAALPMAGLTAWQGLFRHGRLARGQTVLVLGAGGGVGNLAVQIAHHVDAQVIGASRGRDREAAIEAGASAFVDLESNPVPDLAGVSVVLDTIGGQIASHYVANVRDETRFVSIVDSGVIAPLGSRGAFFVVEPDREILERIAERVDAGSIRPGPGESRELKDGANAISAKELGQIRGKLTLTA